MNIYYIFSKTIYDYHTLMFMYNKVFKLFPLAGPSPCANIVSRRSTCWPAPICGLYLNPRFKQTDDGIGSGAHFFSPSCCFYYYFFSNQKLLGHIIETATDEHGIDPSTSGRQTPYYSSVLTKAEL